MTRDFSQEALEGIQQSAGIWFPEKSIEMCLRSDRYDQEITLLHFETDYSSFHADEEVSDMYDRFIGG